MTHQPHHTLPSFTGRTITGSQAETKHQSRIRNDIYAASRYAKRVSIDRRKEEKALRDSFKEVWE